MFFTLNIMLLQDNVFIDINRSDIIYKIRMFTSFLNAIKPKPKNEENEKYIILTYRSHIKPALKETYYNSDSGWGCMLRVGQMAVANYLLKIEKKDHKQLLPLFFDNSEQIFSIQNFTKISNKIYPKKEQFSWFSPCEIGFIIKQVLEQYNQECHVIICNDSSIFKSEIVEIKASKIIIMIMTRIGLDKPEEQYLDTIAHIMKLKSFFSILGGTPKHAHLFLKQKQSNFGFLDPHKTFKAASSPQQMMQKQNEYLGKLQWLHKDKIDSSMCLMFVIDRQQINTFWKDLNEIKQKGKNNFFIYMDQERPEFGQEDGIIEIVQDFQ